MGELYVQQGNEVRVPAVGVSLMLPRGWSVTSAGVARGEAYLWFQHAPYSDGGGSDDLTMTFAPENHTFYSRLLGDDSALRRSFPRRVQLPFGEAAAGSEASEPSLLFTRNRVIYVLTWRERQPEIAAGAHEILRSLRFFEPHVDALPPALKVFKYLHPGVRADGRPPPPGLAVAELRGRLRHNEQSRQLWAPETPRVPDVQLLAQRHYASAPLLAGLLWVLLDDLDQAQRSFVEAADLSEPAAFLAPADLSTYTAALEAAVLAGDRSRAGRIARRYAAVDWPGKFAPDRRAYCLGVPALIAGDTEAAYQLIDGARAVDPRKAWYPGLGELLAAVAHRNPDRLAGALRTVLTAHHARSVRRSEIWNSARSFICVPATVVAIVAAWQGLTLSAELPGRKARLKNLPIVGITEFEGMPVSKGATFALDVDYLPAELVAAAAKV